jgi:hypothetical protein
MQESRAGRMRQYDGLVGGQKTYRVLVLLSSDFAFALTLVASGVPGVEMRPRIWPGSVYPGYVPCIDSAGRKFALALAMRRIEKIEIPVFRRQRKLKEIGDQRRPGSAGGSSGPPGVGLCGSGRSLAARDRLLPKDLRYPWSCII